MDPRGLSSSPRERFEDQRTSRIRWFSHSHDSLHASVWVVQDKSSQ